MDEYTYRHPKDPRILVTNKYNVFLAAANDNSSHAVILDYGDEYRKILKNAILNIDFSKASRFNLCNLSILEVEGLHIRTKGKDPFLKEICKHPFLNDLFSDLAYFFNQMSGYDKSMQMNAVNVYDGGKPHPHDVPTMTFALKGQATLLYNEKTQEIIDPGTGSFVYIKPFCLHKSTVSSGLKNKEHNEVNRLTAILFI